MSYKSFTNILPGRIRSGYRDLLRFSGIKVPGERFLGFTVLFGLGLAMTLGYSLMVFLGLSPDIGLIIFAGTYGIFEGAIYMILYLRVDSRTKSVERILPDALQIMAMNIRAGLTTERALIMTARPEFGLLEKELKKAGKEIMAGKTLKEALLAISDRIKSRHLETTIKLLIDGMDSGGELAALLEHTAADMQNTTMMEKEIKANIMMYVIFIFFAIGIGAPLIFGISTHLVDVLSSQMGRFETISQPDVDNMKNIGVSQFGTFSTFQSTGTTTISPDFLILYAITSLLITSFFGGLIIGVIQNGDEKQGIKYIPVLMGLSLTLFFVTRILAASIFTI